MDADMVDETADTPDGSPAPDDVRPVEGSDQTVDADGVVVDVLDTSDVDVPALMAERDSLRDLAQRIQADFENYRKRVTTQVADDVDRATGRIAESLLSVLDACEAAFVSNPAAIEPLFNLLLGELKKQGLEVLNLEGQPFDPAVAEAVMHEAGDGDSVVVEVLRTGYLWKGRVLRAAMVKVRG